LLKRKNKIERMIKMISFKKEFDGKGYKKILTINGKEFIEVREYKSDKKYSKLACESIMSKIEKDNILNKYKMLIYGVICYEDDDAMESIEKLDNKLKENEGNESTDK
jgi:ribonuclease HII